LSYRGSERGERMRIEQKKSTTRFKRFSPFYRATLSPNPPPPALFPFTGLR